MAPEMQQKRAEFERLPQDEKPATYVFRALAVQNELVRTTPDIFKLSTSKKMLEEMKRNNLKMAQIVEGIIAGRIQITAVRIAEEKV